VALAAPLSQLFQLCYNTCCFPSSWKFSLVHPIPKKGDRSSPSNYRPISLTCSISKVFEGLLNRHILGHIEDHSLLSDKQYGFRSARSTADVLALLSDRWTSALDQHGESCVVALDISKAFDRVWHPALLAKLPYFGFSPSLCRFISSYLSERTFAVVIDGATSLTFHTNLGVPQGAVLSPTLFLIFINDLFASTSNPIHSYADDSTVHVSTSFPRAPSNIDRNLTRHNVSQSISNDLSLIHQWGIANHVSFNSTKTQLLPISMANVPPLFQVNFMGTPLPPSDDINLLGLSFNREMSWRSHISDLTRAASKKLGALFRIRSFFQPSQLSRIYAGCIRPCIEYCSHVWGGSRSTAMLTNIDRRARRLIGSPLVSDSLDTLVLRRTVGTLSLLYRYIHGKCSTELQARVPPPLPDPARITRFALARHPFSLLAPRTRTRRYERSFFPSAVSLWNKLPLEVFPPPDVYAPAEFRSSVSRYLRALPPQSDVGWGFLII
jgi:hypothetical protein